MRTTVTLALVATFAALTCFPASAAIIGRANLGGNVFQDENRESIFDLDGSGTLSVGDVLIGYSRIDTKTTPPPSSLGPTDEFVLFSTQVGSITKLDGTARSSGDDALVSFVPVGADGILLGLNLSSLTGGLVTAPTAMAANFSSVATDKTIISSGVAANIIAIAGEIASEGTLSTVAGIGAADDFWQSFFTSGIAAASPVDFLSGLTSVGLGAAFGNPLTGTNGFSAGLSVLSADTALFADTTTVAGSPTVGSVHQLAIINGNISGAGNADFGSGFNPFFGAISDTRPGASPGDVVSFYGAASNADVAFTALPEPASILVWSVFASIVGSIAYRKSQS